MCSAASRGFSTSPQTQRDIGALSGILGGAVEGDAIEGELRLAAAGDVLEGHRRVAEALFGQRIPVVAAQAAIERIGDQHGVVIGGDINAVTGEKHRIELEVVGDLEDRGVFHERLQAGERLFQRDLAGGDVIAEEIGLAGLVGKRQVTSAAGGKRQADAAESGLHGVLAVGLAADGDMALGRGFGDPLVETIKRCDGLVLGAVEGNGRCGRRPGGDRGGGAGMAIKRRRMNPLTLSLSPLGRGDDAGRRYRRGMGVVIMRHQAGGEGGVVMLGGADGRIGLDRVGIDGIGLGDALGQRRKLDGLEEGDELLRVGLAHAGG